MSVASDICTHIHHTQKAPSADFLSHSGRVLIAFHDALWQLLHAPSLEEAIVDTVARGGDTDTNAAICGALLRAIYGIDEAPLRWKVPVLQCCPEVGSPRVLRPRPECFWPGDALSLAAQFLCGQGASPT
ncbi:MAG: ADP-ribosylglycohydrolase family protein [Chlorobium sp.]|nr:ADP-ribosylglycohydrolase family protein [Chlorobium sp.]